MEFGYFNQPNTHAHNGSLADAQKPLRALAPGLHMGLSLLLDLQEEEYYCSGTESIGFKVFASSL